jgi:hypothetical protein
MNILCQQNGWKEKFSGIIDVDEYFDDHFAWEDKLQTALVKALKNLGKKFSIRFGAEYFIVTFTPKEIEEIYRGFNQETLSNMRHFTNLVDDATYGRRHREEINDYTARSVAYMHKLYEDKINAGPG